QQDSSFRTARNEESVVDSTDSMPIRRSSSVNIQYHTRFSTLRHRPADISSNIQDEFRTAYLEYFENDPLHRPKISRLHTTNATQNILSQINSEILSRLNADTTLLHLQSLVYCGAVTAIRLHGQKIQTSAIDAGQKRIRPWMARFDRRRDLLRKHIGQLTAYNISRSNSRLKKCAVKIYRQFYIHRGTPVVEFMDILKQKHSVVCKRLRRYGESHARRIQNSMYIKNQRQFFSTLGSTDSTRQHASFSVTEVKNYWSAPWEFSKPLALHAEWIDAEHNRYANIATMRLMEVTDDEVRETIVRSSNWKPPDLDKVQNF
ncbi:uncharacterized protein LOC119663439, partial [Teleopsis dalmanni]|uniref:uncharacterized protein LOC119663439 n=1 Tax=Teleopsis dalmanni TaxID=139649 RepID=UPI0018CD7EA3